MKNCVASRLQCDTMGTYFFTYCGHLSLVTVAMVLVTLSAVKQVDISN